MKGTLTSRKVGGWGTPRVNKCLANLDHLPFLDHGASCNKYSQPKTIQESIFLGGISCQCYLDSSPIRSKKSRATCNIQTPDSIENLGKSIYNSCQNNTSEIRRKTVGPTSITSPSNWGSPWLFVLFCETSGVKIIIVKMVIALGWYRYPEKHQTQWIPLYSFYLLGI